jgi:hypothetical protein
VLAGAELVDLPVPGGVPALDFDTVLALRDQDVSLSEVMCR